MNLYEIEAPHFNAESEADFEAWCDRYDPGFPEDHDDSEETGDTEIPK